MSASSRTLLSLLLAIGLGGCAMEDAPMARPCDTSRDCDEGEVCFEDGCGRPVDFAARVSPLSGGEAVTQDFGSVSFAMESIELGLRKPGLLVGVASMRGEGTAQAYAGPYVMQARGRSSAIPGLQFEQSISKQIKSGEAFSLPVPAGIWDVSATAIDPALPPVYTQKVVASGSEVDPGLVLVSGSTHVTELSGKVMKSEQQPWATLSPTLRIQAVDKQTRNPLSQPVVFQAAEDFRLWAARTNGSTALLVSADASSQVPAPTKEFDPVDGVFPGILELGEYGEPFEVNGSVTDEAGGPIAGAEVRAEGTVVGGGRFTATARTDANGLYAFRLFASAPESASRPAATYTVSALPLATSPFASASLEAPIEAAKTLAPIVCRPKRTLRGVVTALEAPLAGALIHYEGNAAAADPGASSGDAKTDADGFFSFDVEPGSYRIIVKPATERRLPWATRRVHTSESFVTITVPSPREVVGVLTDWSGKPVPSAIVTLYRVARESTQPQPPPEMIFQSLTDASGVFKVVVPKAPEED